MQCSSARALMRKPSVLDSQHLEADFHSGLATGPSLDVNMKATTSTHQLLRCTIFPLRSRSVPYQPHCSTHLYQDCSQQNTVSLPKGLPGTRQCWTQQVPLRGCP